MKCLLVLTAVVLATASLAHGQGTDASSAVKMQLARKLYDEAVDAANKGQWSLAYDRFKASYDAQPRIVTLFNLAGAQTQTGRLVEASESYRKLLRETADGKYPDLRADATNLLDSVEKQIARLTLDISKLEGGDLVAIDEVEFPTSLLHEPIPMNPGSHIVVVRRGGAVIATKQITLSTGASESVQLDLSGKSVDLTVKPRSDAQGSVTGTAAMSTHSDSQPRRSALRSPWLWSAAAVVVAGSVTAAYFLTRDNGDVLAVH